jgi:hypothetical protein
VRAEKCIVTGRKRVTGIAVVLNRAVGA